MRPEPASEITKFAGEFLATNGRRARISEIPLGLLGLFGRYVFAMLDWRNEVNKEWTPDLIYVGCVEHCGLKRDRPDAIDARYTSIHDWDPGPLDVYFGGNPISNGTPLKYVGPLPVDSDGYPRYDVTRKGRD